MKKILTVALLLSLALNTYLLFFASSEVVPSQVPNPIKEEQINQNINDQSDGYTFLLEARLKDLEKAIAEISDKSKADQARIQELENLLANKDIAHTNSETKAVSSKVDRLDKEDVRELKEEKKLLIEQFESEKVDPSWAYKVQDDVTDIIHESDLLLSMNFNGIECRTTKCRVSVTPNEQGMGHKITAFFDVSSQLRETEYSNYVTISDSMGDETDEVYIYIAQPKTGE